VLLFYHFDTLRLAAAALALGLAAIACGFLNDATPLLLPSGTKSAMRPVIYVDGSHLEAMGKDPWREDGIGRFMRVLAQSGYLPLLAPEVSAARLKNSTMLVSIAPGRSFSESELADVKEFVAEGGNFLCLAGSPDAEPSQPMLDQFELHIGPMPVPPWKNVAETEPMGSMLADFRPDASIKDLPPGESSVKFHAAWPVSAPDRSTTWPNDDPAHRPVIAGNRTGQDKGQAFLIGDSEFALQKGISPPAESLSPDLPPPQNAAFWQTTLHDWLGPPEVKP
jgi:hypothetical protein